MCALSSPPYLIRPRIETTYEHGLGIGSTLSGWGSHERTKVAAESKPTQAPPEPRPALRDLPKIKPLGGASPRGRRCRGTTPAGGVAIRRSCGPRRSRRRRPGSLGAPGRPAGKGSRSAHSDPRPRPAGRSRSRAPTRRGPWSRRGRSGKGRSSATSRATISRRTGSCSAPA